MSLKRWRFVRIPALLTLVVVSTPPTIHGQAGARNGEWPTYGGDLGHTRYAPLTQITGENFSKLEIAWRFKTDHLGPRPEFNFESTPLMVNGRLFSTGGTRRAVVALDAATGEMLWMHSEHEGPRGAAAPRQLSGRGLAYWTDGREERILYVTPGYRLVALDAKTGIPVSDFGQNGIVDLKLEFDQDLDLVTAPVGLHSTPIVAKNVVIVGAAFETGANPKSRQNVKGAVRGYDVRTGKRLWIFRTIPRLGEFGNDTWERDSWVYTGNTGVWAQISVDEELGMAYLPVELPTHDYYGGERPGNTLFSESLVAVDLQTGQRKWHYQLVHHGIWDMDIPCAPILADITVNGRTIKAVAQPSKQAFLYVFDRVTGQPVWPIEERPVPKGDVSGEWYSPTQPFPTKPAAYDRQGPVGRRPDRLHAGTTCRSSQADLAVQDRTDLHTARRQQSGRADRDALDGKSGRGYELAWRLLRSGNAHPLRWLAERRSDTRSRPAASRYCRRALSPGHGLDGSQALGRLRRECRSGCSSGRRGRRGCRHESRCSRPAVDQASVRPHQRHRSRQRRNSVAGAKRRDAGQDQEPSGSEGHDTSAYRTTGQHRNVGDQDAGHRRRARLRANAVRSTRRDVARLRQDQRQRDRRRLHAGATDWIADDLHAERQAVPRRRSEWRELFRRTACLQSG